MSDEPRRRSGTREGAAQPETKPSGTDHPGGRSDARRITATPTDALAAPDDVQVALGTARGAGYDERKGGRDPDDFWARAAATARRAGRRAVGRVGGGTPHARAGSAHPRTPEDRPRAARRLDLGGHAPTATHRRGRQLATVAGFSQVVASGGLAFHTAPVVVAAGQRYYWRVRYVIGVAARYPLPWSEAFSSSTRAVALVYQPQVAADFLTVANAAGRSTRPYTPLSPPTSTASRTRRPPPHPSARASRRQVRVRSDQGWALFTFGERQTFDEWLGRVTQDGALVPHIVGSSSSALYVASLACYSSGQLARHRPVRAVDISYRSPFRPSLCASFPSSAYPCIVVARLAFVLASTRRSSSSRCSPHRRRLLFRPSSPRLRAGISRLRSSSPLALLCHRLVVVWRSLSSPVFLVSLLIRSRCSLPAPSSASSP